MRCGKELLGLLVLGSIPATTSGQTVTPTPLISEGDTVIGLGAISAIFNPAINDNRMWTSLVDTNYAVADTDNCVLRNGFLTLREGMALFAPANSVLDEWDSISLTNNGDLGMVFRYKTGTTSLEGAFWNLLPVAVKDTVITANFVDPAANWETFGYAKMNDRNQLFVIGEIDNPGVSGTKEDALVRYDLDSSGNILATTVIWSEGMFIDLMGTTVQNTARNAEHSLAVNNLGDCFTFISGLGSSYALFINNDTLVAQEGFPSPIPGRPWRTLSLAKLSITDRRDFVYSGSVTGDTDTQYVIITNIGGVEAKFSQAGDIIPSISPTTPVSGGTASPIYMDINGHVFWRAEMRGTNEDAFVRDYTPIVQQNKTRIGGNLVTDVLVADNSFAISPNGRFWVGRVQLQMVGEALLLADFGLVLEIPGCYGNPGKLSHTSGMALVGQTLELAMDDGQAPGVLPGIVVATRPRINASGCGVPTIYGEVMIVSSSRVATLFPPTWDGSNPSLASIPIPNDLALVDGKFYAQGYFRDPSPGAPEKFRLTNALRIEIGPP